MGGEGSAADALGRGAGGAPASVPIVLGGAVGAGGAALDGGAGSGAAGAALVAAGGGSTPVPPGGVLVPQAARASAPAAKIAPRASAPGSATGPATVRVRVASAPQNTHAAPAAVWRAHPSHTISMRPRLPHDAGPREDQRWMPASAFAETSTVGKVGGGSSMIRTSSASFAFRLRARSSASKAFVASS